jgi:hypothetical protein
MRAWAYLLGGLIVWAVHFFTVYIAASLFLTSATTRVIAGLATLLCLAAAAWLTGSAWRQRQTHDESFLRWSDGIAILSGGTALVSVLWQGLPALLI